MANAQYPLSKNAFLNGQINLGSDTIQAVLVDLGAYTYSAAHDNLDDIPSGARLGTPLTLASKTIGTIAAGVFDAADGSLGTPASSAEALVIYKSTGTESTSTLLWFLDTGVGGLPVSAGGAASVTWNAGGIFVWGNP